MTSRCDKAEKELQELKERFYTLINSVPDIVIFKDAQNRYLEANGPAVAFFGLDERGYVGRKNLELAKESPHLVDAFQTCEDTDNSTWNEGVASRYDEVIPRVDGTLKTLDVLKIPVLSPAGERKLLVVVGRNVTEQRQAELALRRSEAQMRALITNLPVEFWAMDKDLRYTMQNTTSVKHFGDLVGKRIQDMGLGPEAESRWLKQAMAVINGGLVRDKYFTEIAGEAMAFENVLAPVFVEGAIVGIVGIGVDVTDRWRVDKTLREAEEKFRVMIEDVNDVIFSLDGRGIFTYISQGVERFSHFLVSDFVGRNFSFFVHPDDRQAIEESFRQSLKGKAGYAEFRVVDRDGSVIHVRTSSNVLRDGDRPIGIIGVMVNIGERKLAEDALQQQLSLTQTLLDAVPVPVFYKDSQGKYLGCNRAFQRYLGKRLEEIVGRNVYDIYPPEQAEHYSRADAELLQNGGPQVFESSVKGADGTSREVVFNKATFLAKDGTVGGLIGTMLDITDRKAAEKLLVQARDDLEQRVGMRTAELARANAELRKEIADRGLAEQAAKDSRMQAELYMDLMGHDINNLNQIVMGYLELALESKRLHCEEKELLDQSIEVLKRSTRLVENVRKLQKISEGEISLKMIDLHGVLLDVQKDFTPLSGVMISLNFDTEARDPVMANELLYDVFSNLVDNAIRHSAGESVNVTINLHEMHKRHQSCYRVSVEDNGPGIPDHMKRAVFNRMDRDAKKVKGLGLGLYLVRCLAESFGGAVWVEDRVPGNQGLGSRFVVALPICRRR